MNRQIRFRWYWRCRAWWARLSTRLRGYPPRPPLDDLLPEDWRVQGGPR